MGTLTDWRAAAGARLRREPGVQAAVPYIESAGDARQRRDAWPAPTCAACCPSEERTATGLAQRIDRGQHRGPQAGQLPHHSRRCARARAGRAGRGHGGADRPGGHGDADRRGAAHAPLPGHRASSSRACTSSTAGWRSSTWPMPRACSALGDGVTGLAPGAERSAARAGHRGARRALTLGRRVLRQRLDRNHANFFRSIEITKSMMFVILLHDRRGRGLQHRRDAGDDREGEADRHRDPAHPGRRPAQRAGDLRDPGRADRAGRHAAGRRSGHAAGGQPGGAGRRRSSGCSARSFSMRASTT